MAEVKNIKLKVTGDRTIHCAGCERSVEFILANLPGVRGVEADHKTQMIKLTLVSEETDFETVRAELDWIGYQVTPV